MPGPALGSGDKAVNTLDKNPLPSWGLQSSGEMSEPHNGYNIRHKKRLPGLPWWRSG